MDGKLQEEYEDRLKKALEELTEVEELEKTLQRLDRSYQFLARSRNGLREDWKNGFVTKRPLLDDNASKIHVDVAPFEFW